MMNRIPIEGTDLHIWADARQYIVGKLAKCKVTKKNPEGISPQRCTYHSTVSQAVVEIFERVSRGKVKDCDSLDCLRLSHLEMVEWIKNLFPNVNDEVKRLSEKP